MTMRNNRFGRQSGFSLIEAMVAVVVLATGLLALTALQMSLMRSSADSKARSQLAAYASGEIDRYRAQGVAVGTVDTNTAPAGHPLVAVRNAAGLSRIVQTTTSVPYVFDPATGVFVANGPVPTSQPFFQRVRVNIGWVDTVGGNRQISFDSDISPLALIDNPVLVDRELPDPDTLRPIVRRPTPVTEGMIPIAVSGSEDTAATNPKPLLVGKQNNTLVSDTRFDVLTYSPGDNLGNPAFVRFNKRIETAMVGCTCQTGLGGFPTGGNSPAFNEILKVYAFRPSYWDGERYTEPKRAGTPVASPSLSATQSRLCDVCCRDHRDDAVPAGQARFNPWSSTHAHYLEAEGSPVLAGTFIEACRVIRTNGVWRVTPDPRVEDVALVATREFPETTGGSAAPADNNRATSPLIANAGTTSYVAFAFDAIKTIFFDRTAFDVVRAATQVKAGLNAPDYVPIKAGDKRWLHARALLVDFLEPDAIKRLDRAKADCKDPGDDVERAQCVLPFSPLATVNITELARWAGRATSGTGITPFAGLTVNFAEAMLRRYPSGIALFSPVNPTDDDDALVDEQQFVLSAGTATGQWLQVASPSAVLFGDPANPSRGFATVPGGFKFNFRWSGVAAATNNNKSDDPQAEVGLDSSNPCTAGTGNNTSNDYACVSATATNTVLAVGGFNRVVGANGNINNPCPGGTGKIGEGQAKCLVHTISGLSIDGVAVSSVNELAGGTVGWSNEKRKVVLPLIKSPPATPSTVIMTFTANDSKNAQAVCNVSTFAGWNCDY